MSNDSNLRDAITYLLDNAEPEGLELECLAGLIRGVEYLRTKRRPLTRDEYMGVANDALYEWDI